MHKHVWTCCPKYEGRAVILDETIKVLLAVCLICCSSCMFNLLHFRNVFRNPVPFLIQQRRLNGSPNSTDDKKAQINQRSHACL